MKKEIYIFGSGGLACETAVFAMACGYEIAAMVDIEEGGVCLGEFPIIAEKNFPLGAPAVIGIGDVKTRAKIAQKIQADWQTIIHPNVVYSKYVNIGKGSVICPGSILTCNITLGNHCYLNLGTTIGHDCVIGDYFITAPGVNISGNNTIGHSVYIGSNAATKQGVSIVDHCTIGMGATVVKNLTEAGVYVGTPAKLKI